MFIQLQFRRLFTNLENTLARKLDYEFLDCGGGRKLERFGEVIIDRPALGAFLQKKHDPEKWHEKNGIFFKNKDRPNAWFSSDNSLRDEWKISIDDIKVILKPTPTGQVGMFPEQIENWRELKKNIKHARCDLKILNVFAYTGIATLFASSASSEEHKVEVTHVDAAKSSVNWAKANAEASKLDKNQIRWIVDDAVSFMEKEIRRGSKYDGIILDPPAFGRSKTGKTWSLKKDMPYLFDLISGLMSEDPLFVLISCHDTEVTSDNLAKELSTMKFAGTGIIKSGDLTLKAENGATLDSGVYAHWMKK